MISCPSYSVGGTSIAAKKRKLVTSHRYRLVAYLPLRVDRQTGGQAQRSAAS